MRLGAWSGVVHASGVLPSQAVNLAEHSIPRPETAIPPASMRLSCSSNGSIVIQAGSLHDDRPGHFPSNSCPDLRR